MNSQVQNPDTRPLPFGWACSFDTNHQTWFYIDKKTGVSQWEHPETKPYAPPPGPPSHLNSPPAYHNTGYPTPPATGGYVPDADPRYQGGSSVSPTPLQQQPYQQPYQQQPYQQQPYPPDQKSYEQPSKSKKPGIGGMLGGLLGSGGGKLGGQHGPSGFGGYQQPKPPKKHGGMGAGGLALGAGAGLLGGLLIADAVDDIGDQDYGGDFGGFDDGGGFDF